MFGTYMLDWIDAESDDLYYSLEIIFYSLRIVFITKYRKTMIHLCEYVSTQYC